VGPRGRNPHQGERRQPRRKRRLALSSCATMRTSWYDKAAGNKGGDAKRRAKLCESAASSGNMLPSSCP
jgi:hypothetical protein